ncbi:hypothetical protein L873DRAFT_1941310 [Choiromyces venosus 120613-1]|uniref:Uncharacterized protein n=1 Tax=Choiromyces venosus 120613-1 TaxID=1336337 RepID=A0A3N4JJ78_9PEZI|nr:hypothetical protein L873DRAFT_1941310 [Choiromyces venosus 120613-1]
MTRYPPSEAGLFGASSSVAPPVMEAAATTGTHETNEVRISAEISGLIRAIQKHGPVRTVQAHLQGLSKAEKALQVVDMLNLHQQQGEVLAVIVAHVWENYVVPEKLWEHYHGGESRFKEDGAYDEFIAPTLQSVKVSQSRKNKQISRLESCWGAGWEKTIDVHTDHPSVLSEHYLRNMAKLASSGMTLSDAQLILQHVMKTRISHPAKGVRAQGIIMVSDIQKVVSAVSAVSRSQNIEPEECSPMQLITFLAAEAAGAHWIPAKTPSQGVWQPERSLTGGARSPTPHGLLSPSPTPLSKHSWSLPHVDAHRVTTARPFSKDLSGSPTNQVPLAIESTAPLLMQSQALPDVSNTPPYSSPSLQEAGPSTQLALTPSYPPPFRLPGTPDVQDSTLEDVSTGHQECEPDTPPSLLRSPSLSPGGTGPVLSLVGSHISSPRRLGSRAMTPVYHSFPPSPFPSAALTVTPQLHTIHTYHDSPQARPSGSTGQSAGFVTIDPAPSPIDPTTGSAGLTSNSPSPMPPAQPRARKCRYIDYTSGLDGISQPYHFKLPDNWADCSPIGPALHRDGFYKSTDVLKLADASCSAEILKELSVYQRFTQPADNLCLDNCFHSLVQQALVQSPYVYLAALAAMETTNHRLISLPVPLIIFPGSPGSPLMDSTFPFAKYIQSDKKVPGTRLLYSLDDANIRIGTSSSTEEGLTGLWCVKLTPELRKERKLSKTRGYSGHQLQFGREAPLSLHRVKLFKPTTSPPP